ncbi:BnaC03g35520D [Brassica napus]|uniref:BnaC03g35520D protein n=2 Tax=Brassica TaxID=3705 RepID=A0A078F3L0_BRANA|nr:BnaC03g35520D [Brassica napus]
MLQGITKNMCGDMHIKYLTLLRARTILVDGALREGEPLIPLPSFEIMVLLTFSSPST